jgi:ketosteroid isomerase-like protein
MKRKNAILLAAMLVAGLATAGAAQDEAEIRSRLARWVEAFNGGDLKTAAQVWAPDLIGWAPEGADDTYASEMESATRAAGKPPTVTYGLEINEIIVSGDLAVVRDTWTETPRSEPVKVRRFRSFEVWRRQPDGAWKIARWIDGPVQPTIR